MQSDVDDILQAGAAISFEDRDGQSAQLDLVTARNFKESAAERILLVGRRRWEREEDTSTNGTIYNGYWLYPVYLYVPSQPRDLDDYSDFEEAGRAGQAFLKAILPGSEWEFNDQDIYEAQMSSRELVACEIEIRTFATRRFL